MLDSSLNRNASNASQIRRGNRRLLLHELRLRGSLSRAELARSTGLTPPAIASIVQDLLDAGLVRETGRRKTTRGQPPIAIEIDKEGGYSIGLRVEASQYDFVVANLAGDVVEAGSGPVTDDGEDGLLDLLTTLHARLAGQYGVGRSLGLGLVTPGPFDASWPGIPTPGAIPSLQTRSLVDKLSERLGVDVFLENDATAAALGERLLGAAKQATDFFYIFVGEGVGGGIVVRGEPYRGRSGNAGEFGHLIIDPNGHKCYCGNRGCLGQYLSLSSLRRRLDGVRAGEHMAAAEAEWVGAAAWALSIAIAGVENLLDPAMIVLGGTAPADLLAAIVQELGALRPSVRQGLGNERLVMSELGERSAALGASALPIIAATSPL